MSEHSEAFERDKTAYEQNYEQFRSLNQTMWQVPVIAITLTGGLWFGAAKTSEMPGFQYLLLAFAAASNIGLVVVLGRVRFVMGEYLEAIKSFNTTAFVSAEGKWFWSSKAVVLTFRLLLLMAAGISVIAILLLYTADSKPQTRRVIEVIDVTK